MWDALKDYSPLVVLTVRIPHERDRVTSAAKVDPSRRSDHKGALRTEFHTFAADSKLERWNRVRPDVVFGDLHIRRAHCDGLGFDGFLQHALNERVKALN
jgi:hypothetical protein